MANSSPGTLPKNEVQIFIMFDRVIYEGMYDKKKNTPD